MITFVPRDARNYRVFTVWMMLSMAVFAAATLLIDGSFIPSALGWVLTALASLLMMSTVRAYTFFIRHADELLRKIHLDALALGFGGGVVAMMTYRLCERLGAPKLDINDSFFVMMIVWIGGQYIGARRYAGVESDE